MKVRIIICLCLAVCLTVLGVSGYMVWNNYAEKQNELCEKEENNRQTTIDSTPDETGSIAIHTEPETVDAETAARADQQELSQLGINSYQNNVHDFKMLRSLNSDCIGWMKIPGTIVDYPVMHTMDDPEKYYDRGFYGTYSISGVPFLDAGCTEYSNNLIIYGRDMNSGTMFAPLLNYESKSFAQEHPIIQFETEQGLKNYSVYAVARVMRNDVFYTLKDAPNKEYFDQRVTNITQRALYTVGTQPQFGQKLITLSTCTNTSYDDRIIVIAVQK